MARDYQEEVIIRLRESARTFSLMDTMADPGFLREGTPTLKEGTPT